MQTKAVALLLIGLVVAGEASAVALQSQIFSSLDVERIHDLGYSADINKYLDELFANIEPVAAAIGLDPMPLPDLREGVEFKPLFITYSTWVYLTQGTLTNLNTMQRGGDCIVSYFAKMLRVQIHMTFRQLEFVYNYRTQVMGIGLLSGKAYGTVRSMDAICDLLIDFNNDEVHLQKLELTNITPFGVRVSGNILLDWFLSPMVAVLTRVFNDLLMTIVQSRMRDIFNDHIADLNAFVKEVFANLE